MAERDLRLLSLDGGGVRGLSTLYILKNILQRAAGPDEPLPKPCDYFDMIGGTSTGGLIAIMLGRLGMTVDECIDAYLHLSKEIFGKKKSRLPFNYKMELSTQFDSKKLEEVIKTFPGANELLASETAVTAKCKVVVCAVRRSNSQPAFLRSYQSTKSNDLARYVSVWQACRATSAAPGFFDPISIGPNKQELIDGGLGYNNPVESVYAEARDIWGPDDAQLQRRLISLISIGTGVPKPKTLDPGLRQTLKTLGKIVSDTQTTANRFRRDKAELAANSQYFRFNVDNGLQGIGLEEHQKQNVIADATSAYLDRPDVTEQLATCGNILRNQHMQLPIHDAIPSSSSQAKASFDEKYRVQFSLAGVPFADKFVDRPEDMQAITSQLLPAAGRDVERRREIYVLHGMGGIGKTQLAANFFTRFGKQFSAAFWLKANTEQDLRHSLIRVARRLPAGQISESHRKGVAESLDEEKAIVEEVLEWFANDENRDWLLVFDNVDLDPDLEKDRQAGAYDLMEYLLANHGAVLMTTRLQKMAQLAGSENGDRGLSTVSLDMSRQIFQTWFGSSSTLSSLGPDATQAIEDLVGPEMLGGLPLAIAQAAVYVKNTRITISEYKRRYNKMWQHVMDVAGNKTPIQGYHKSVGTTWSLSLQQVEERDPNAGPLVRTWAFLDSKDFWYGLIAELGDDFSFWNLYGEGIGLDEWRQKYESIDPAAWLETMLQNEAKYLECMNTLLDFGLVERVRVSATSVDIQGVDDMEKGFMMHPVVHSWAMQMQSDEEKALHLRYALQLFATQNDPRAWPWAMKQRWHPHAGRCYAWVMAACSVDDQATRSSINHLASVLAIYNLMGLSNFAHTEEQRAAGLQLLEERIRGHHSWDHEGGPDAFQGDHRVLVPWGLLWYILREHGVILMRLDHPGDKIKVEEALRLATWAGGELHWTTLDSLSTLSLLYHRRFDMKKSEQTLLKMSHLLDKIPPERRSRKIRYQSARNAVRLGQVYAHNRRFAEAEEQLHMALSIGEQLSDLHLQAFAAFELGASCLKHGQYEEAEMWLRKTFDWQAATLGDGHTNTLGTIAELAWVYAVQNDQERAQHMLGLAFSSKVVSSTTSNLIAFSSHLRYMRARGEDTSPMETILKRAWDEALEILRSGGHKTLSFPHFRSLYTTYDDLEQFYREKKRKKELKAIRRDMAPFEADWDAFHWSEKSDSMSSEHLGEGTDDEAHADQGNSEQGVADEGNSDGRNSLQAGSDPGEADAVVTGSRDPISRPHERRASV